MHFLKNPDNVYGVPWSWHYIKSQNLGSWKFLILYIIRDKKYYSKT